MTPRTRNLLSWLLSGLLALGLAGAGASKLAGAAEQLQNLQSWGYPEWLRYPIGIGELLLALGLLVPKLRTLALYGMLGWVLVATGTHLQAGQAAKLGGVVAFAVLALADWLVWRKAVLPTPAA